MSDTIQLVIHIIVTLAAVVGLALRLEHRITKIETDINWLKNNCHPNNREVQHNGKA